MAKLPISTKTFEHIISEGMVYVDKTAFVWKLSQEGKYYFLSRPRRFGKSLLISTLKSFFEGHKDLFKGLFIANKEKEWKKHPIIFIDYSLIEYRKGVEIFEQSLLNYIANTGQEYGIVLQQKATIAEAFTELIKRLHEQYGKVVILVDEYDKALADTLNDKVKFKDNREVLRGLYGVMKGLDDYLRFVMLTGVSRFAKVSVFSGMNNLKDISLSEEFNEIVGFTQKELEHYFSDYLKQVQEKFGTTSPTLKESIRKKYNGFSWDGKNKLYNPYSILNFLTDKAFRNYWFSSGTPNFLVNLIKEQQQLPEKLENIKVTDLEGNTTQIEKLPLLPILFQTGYLTIQQIEYDGFDERFLLNYPNEEVRESFIRYVVASFVGKNEFELQSEALKLRDALREERIADFTMHLQSFLADIPARLHIDREAYYHSLVYMILRLVGVQLILEKETDKGRIDAVLELPDKIYIIEFKFGTSNRMKNAEKLANKAIQQIEEKQYQEAYLSSNKRILLLGFGYSNKELGFTKKEL